MNSLKTRLSLSSTIVLIFFVSLTGIIIDRAYVAKATSSVSIRLQSQIYEILRKANLDERDDLLGLSNVTLDSHLTEEKSGYYAAIAHDNKVSWYSPSNKGIQIPYYKNLKPGEHKFQLIQADDGSQLFLLSIGYDWSIEDVKPLYYTFNVAESDITYRNEISVFRYNLWSGLGLIVLLSFFIQKLVIKWGLKPLVRLRNDLSLIEEGKRDYLESNYIDEIKDLTTDLNTLLRFERARQERYRNSLGDLAHSFKTSLSIINSTTKHEIFNEKDKGTLIEQVDVLNDLVTYHLRRAQAAGTKASLNKPVNVQLLIDKIRLALSKVYKDKKITLQLTVDSKAMFYGDKGDLLEVLGNLLDNAYKWCNNVVKITVIEEKKSNEKLLTIAIENDGPGIPDDKQQEILKRGIRIDEHTPGHGIGMSIVTDIIAAYCGELTVSNSNLGGAKFVVSFKH